ncbi:gamma-tubulin complex component 2 homolog [Contarinia nasturtii]|uniref:gamma-tubulin complex component 2 homolog n=1 Tax=Contarinia nasturtii TaxID=265458 RepID=UPI0012D43F50|nr:gamma-tubulin complex component 2 homolog [Contarinia nasturtii]
MDLIEQVSKMNETSSQKNIEVDFTSPYNSSLSGLECFAFGYKVEWPVSIILNPWSLSQYQMLFRLLFYCKHVERQLCKVWIEMCGISKGMSKENKTQWRIAFALRQRMFNAIQHLENYMLIEIIEPNWHAFTERMKNVRNIDEVIIIHQDFLHVCLQNCCLNHLNILRPVISMCGVCLNFAKFIQRDAGINVSIQWQENIKEYGKQFDTFLFQLLNSIKEMTSDQLGGAKLVNLVHAINFNSYYNENIEENGVKNKPAQSE